MINAKRSKIIKERCHQGIKEIKIAKPKPYAPIVRFTRPNRIRLGGNPRIVDPFEQNHVYVNTAGNMGEGLYSRKNITEGNVVAYYSGLLLNPKQTPLITRNMTMDQGWETQTMNIQFNETHIIHLPKYFWDISKLRSTLGHKVNHNFKLHKTRFDFCFHPRFGDIRCIIATSNITKGEEIFTYYQYMPGKLVPKWYSDLYLRETGNHWKRN